jgi:ribonuclease-3
MEKTNYTNDGFIVKNQDGDDEIIHIPYNLNNILISEQDIMQILIQYNVKVDCIKRIEYFRQAFTHKSYCKKDIFPSNILELARNELGNPAHLLDLFDKSYERLEYFGDRVLKVIVSMYLFHRYPKQDEGFMTRLQTKLEDKKNLAIMSKEIGLGKYFIISKQIELMNGRNLEKIHEDVFESFVGALFLSNGFEPCMFLIVNLLETLIDYSEKLYCDNNYKDQLLRIHHQNKWTFPQYITIHFEGPPHKRKYIMGVEKQNISDTDTLQTRCISYGIGSSKKEGEQNAAKMALIIHGILNQDQYSQSDIYYPPWDKIDKFDGETMIIKINEPENIINDMVKVDESVTVIKDIIKDNIEEKIVIVPVNTTSNEEKSDGPVTVTVTTKSKEEKADGPVTVTITSNEEKVDGLVTTKSKGKKTDDTITVTTKSKGKKTDDTATVIKDNIKKKINDSDIITKKSKKEKKNDSDIVTKKLNKKNLVKEKVVNEYDSDTSIYSNKSI